MALSIGLRGEQFGLRRKQKCSVLGLTRTALGNDHGNFGRRVKSRTDPPITLLQADMNALLESDNNTQHWRRYFVRASAAPIEGYAHYLREMCAVSFRLPRLRDDTSKGAVASRQQVLTCISRPRGRRSQEICPA